MASQNTDEIRSAELRSRVTAIQAKVAKDVLRSTPDTG
jgi:hypothetical protein